LWFATLWVLVEFARGHLFTGFPWNLAGYALMADEGLMQIASQVGIYGMSWVVVMLAVLPAALWLRYRYSRLVFALGILLFIGMWGWGQWRLTDDMMGMEARGYVDTVPDVKLRLVQANIAQHHKWDPKLQFEGLRHHVTLSMSEGVGDITHIIWPETAVPYVIREDSTLTTRIGQMLAPKQLLITGGLHAEEENIYNSIAAVDHRGVIVGRYDKHKLVPFGEFLPLRWLIPDSLETPVGMKDFSAGAGLETLKWQGLPSVSPLICYESIFPELAVAETRPDFLLNLTNDAWFGLSTGPHQHFHMARLRAVEQGLPLVRVANTGISAVIDSYGRIRGMIPLGKEGVLDINLPLPLAEPGLYRDYPDLTVYFLLFIIAFLMIYQRKIKVVN
jgi:apolipoprotein N-acyltransferase